MQIDLALIELGVIMLTLALLGRAAARFGIPTIPVFLVAGLFFGEGGFVPVEEAGAFIEIGASLGVIFLLFMLGLEFTPKELNQSMRTNAGAGVIDALLNVAPGVAAGFMLGWGPLGAAVLGGVTYVSSSGIIAKLLTDLGRLGNRETPLILSILVIEDIVMAIFLPVLAVMLAGDSAISGVVSGTVAVAIVISVLLFSGAFGSMINKLVGTSSNETVLLTLLGLATLVAGLAEYVHVSYAIGAFLLGIAISGQVAELAREMLVPLRDAFAALFFVYFGITVNPSSLIDVAIPAMALAAVGVATKMGTGWWAAHRAGLARKGILRTSLMLIPRGEFSIVLAGIGVANGLDSDLGPLVVAYVLILAVGGSIAIRFVK
jgi:monovalent cation:H+ antiporter-2, CPA2 family